MCLLWNAHLHLLTMLKSHAIHRPVVVAHQDLSGCFSMLPVTVILASEWGSWVPCHQDPAVDRGPVEAPVTRPVAPNF